MDIRWYDVFVPWGGTYRPIYLAAGAIAVDLLLAVGLTSLARARLSDRAWRVVHLLAYPSWAASVAHTVGIGTDMATPWLRVLVVGCVGVVVAVGVTRLALVRRMAPGRA